MFERGVTKTIIGVQTKWLTDFIPSDSYTVNIGSVGLPVQDIFSVNASISSNLEVAGTASISGDVWLDSNASVSGNFEVSGTASISALTINDSFTGNNLIDWSDFINASTLDANKTVASGTFSFDWGSTQLLGLQDPTQITASSQYTTKEYVDAAAGGFPLDFFFTNTASGSNFIMQPTETGEATSTIASSSFGISNDNRIVTYETEPGEPNIDELEMGIFDVHLHAQITSGGKSVRLYWTLSKRVIGGAETILLTSEEKEITTSDAHYDIHATLLDDTTLLTTDRLVLNIYANVSGGGASVEITISQEGDTASHLEIETSSQTLTNRYVSRNGAFPMLGNWAVGGFDITGIGLLTATNASVSGNFEASGHASASLYFGTGLEVAGDCNDSTEGFGYDSGTGLFSCRTLAVADVSATGGTGIGISTNDFTFDATEIEAVTWGAGGNATNLWTFNLSDGDPTMNWTGSGATLSLNFETIGYSSASFFQGSAFSGIPGAECSDAGDTLAWENGEFTCGTDQSGAFDATTIDAVTWSDGTNASNLWTFDLSGTNPTLNFVSGGFSFGGFASISSNLEVGGTASISNSLWVNGGNVGIGTVSPGDPLHLVANATDDIMRLEENSGGEYYTMEVNSTGALQFVNEDSTTVFRLNDNNQVIVVESGTEGSPSLIIGADINTGIWSVTADILGFSTGGAERFRIANGGASFSFDLEVGGFASASQIFGGSIASHSFLGSLTGPTTGTLSVGTSDNPLKILWANIVRIVTKFILPLDVTPTEDGEMAYNTASDSLDLWNGTDVTAILAKCPAEPITYHWETLDTAKVTSLQKYFEGKHQIDWIRSISSGSNSVGWDLDIEGTKVFGSGGKSASTSFKYTSFTNSVIIDSYMNFEIASTSAVNEAVNIDVCSYPTH